MRGQEIQNGETVLLKNIGLKGKHKLADKWQKDAFVVIGKPNEDIPVYTIKRGKVVKNIHRNLLLPVRLPLCETEEVQRKQPHQTETN